MFLFTCWIIIVSISRFESAWIMAQIPHLLAVLYIFFAVRISCFEEDIVNVWNTLPSFRTEKHEICAKMVAQLIIIKEYICMGHMPVAGRAQTRRIEF